MGYTRRHFEETKAHIERATLESGLRQRLAREGATAPQWLREAVEDAYLRTVETAGGSLLALPALHGAPYRGEADLGVPSTRTPLWRRLLWPLDLLRARWRAWRCGRGRHAWRAPFMADWASCGHGEVCQHCGARFSLHLPGCEHGGSSIRLGRPMPPPHTGTRLEK